jgi:hypothetical protein
MRENVNIKQCISHLILEQGSHCSWNSSIVKTEQGSELRRNRRHLLKTEESFYPKAKPMDYLEPETEEKVISPPQLIGSAHQ